MIERYLSQRSSLKGVCLVMDIRHPLTDFDRRMVDWCRHYRLPVHILLTKADKLSRGASLDTLLKVQQELARDQDREVSVQLLSALKAVGIAEAHAALDRWLAPPEPTPGET
jgi:GTP-binding protein